MPDDTITYGPEFLAGLRVELASASPLAAEDRAYLAH